MSSIKTIILSLLMFFVYWPSQLIPKKKGLWIFGAWNGEKYGDNTKYLFEYIGNNKPDIKAVWLTRDKTAFDLINAKNQSVVWAYSFKGFLCSIRAEKIFITVGVKDVNRFVINRKNVVLMWHGNTPIKKIVFDDKITRKDQSLLDKILFNLFPFMGMTKFKGFTISGSDEASKIFETAFLAKDKQILLTGYPRNDSFFRVDQRVPLIKDLESLKETNTSSVIYMPTHRKEGKGNILKIFDMDLDKLNKSFKLINSKLYVKLHYFHLKQLNFTDRSHLHFINDYDIEQDIYTVLANFDIMITDFSSVHFDFLLMDRPIIFAPFDKEEYLKDDREFYFNYDDVTPGPHAENWSEILKHIEKFVQDPTLFEEERMQVKSRFNKYTDANNCQRVFSVIENLN